MKNYKIRLISLLIICIFALQPAVAYDDNGYWDDFDDWYYDDYDDWDWGYDDWGYDDHDDDPWYWNEDDDSFWINEVSVSPDYGDDDDDWGSGDDWWRHDDDWYNDDDGEDCCDEDDNGDNYQQNKDNNDGNDNNTNKELSDAEKEQRLNEIIKELEKRTGLKVGTVQLSQLVSRAYYDSRTGIIYVCDPWFRLSGENKISVLYHECYHKNNDLFVLRQADGQFISISTGEAFPFTERELEKIIKDCKEESEFQPDPLKEKGEKDCLERELSLEYTYKPSNYYLNEINAYTSELEGEKAGYWSYTEEERQEKLDRIANYTDSYDRAKEYENKNDYNPDGTKK